jgi:hypothetical protein
MAPPPPLVLKPAPALQPSLPSLTPLAPPPSLPKAPVAPPPKAPPPPPRPAPVEAEPLPVATLEDGKIQRTQYVVTLGELPPAVHSGVDDSDDIIE